MAYYKRLAVAAVCSIVLHALILSPGGCLPKQRQVGLASRKDPIILNLKPLEPQPVRRLVDTLTPSREPVEPTDLISNENSKAQDMSKAEEQRLGPHFAEPSEFDRMAFQHAGPVQPQPAVTAERKKTVQPGPKEESPTPQRTQPTEETVLVDETGSGTQPQEQPFEVARAQTLATPKPVLPGRPSGRVAGSAKNKGILGFEAVKHELAPYLQEVRNRVERHWYAALQLKYSGASKTKAVLDCVIAPDGRLLAVTIVAPGDSVSYAPLCKEAIEKAGPFPPFPFEVPDAYRSENLEIRWTFSFL